MRINNNEIANLATFSEKVGTTNNKEIKVFETNIEEKNVLNTTIGTSAEVNVSNAKAAKIPGFTEQKLQIKNLEGQAFEINLFIQGSADPEKVKQLSEKLTKTLSNLPTNTLEDLQKECKHIFILKNIPHNTQAKALAIGPLNQIFISSDRMAEEPEEELANTITHELGHLVDRTNMKGNEQCSKLHVDAFKNVKNTLINDLGFDSEFHSLDKPSELFADYYLYKSGNSSENHRCRKIFDTLRAYKTDVENLTPKEFNTKYGEKSEKINFLISEWSKLESNYDAFLKYLDKGTIPRMNEEAQPLSLEQIQKINSQ